MTDQSQKDSAVVLADTTNATAIAVSREQKDLWKRMYCRGATDDEAELIIGISIRTGLSLEARQLFPVQRWDADLRKMVFTVQTSIDGFRLIAERTKRYAGQLETEWLDKNGRWLTYWADSFPPVGARVGVLRKDFEKPMFAYARFEAYAGRKKNGQLNSMWTSKPEVMIAKCAEALALRKAFPQELSGLYTEDEIEVVPTEDLSRRAAIEDKKSKTEAMLDAFSKYEVTRFMLEDYCDGKKIDDFSDTEITKCQLLYRQFKSGEATSRTLSEALYPDNREFPDPNGS